MKLDKFLREYVLVGFVIMLVIITLLIYEAKDLINLFQSDYNLTNRGSLIKESCHKLIAYVAMTFTAIFLFVGYKKRHVERLAPWMLAAFAGLTFVTFLIVGNLMTIPYGDMEFMLYTLAIMGLEMVIVYPLYSLFDEMRRQKAKRLRRQARNRLEMVKITAMNVI